LRAFIPLNTKELIIHLYFYLGSNGTISNLKNKANYSLKSGPIFKDHITSGNSHFIHSNHTYQLHQNDSTNLYYSLNFINLFIYLYL